MSSQRSEVEKCKETYFENNYLYDVTPYFGKRVQTFQRNLLHPSSGNMNACSQKLQVRRKVGTYLPDCMG